MSFIELCRLCFQVRRTAVMFSILLLIKSFNINQSNGTLYAALRLKPVKRAAMLSICLPLWTACFAAEPGENCSLVETIPGVKQPPQLQEDVAEAA